MVEKHLGVFLLVVSGFGKNATDLFVSLFARNAGCERIAVSSLGLAGKGGEKIVLRLGSLQCGHTYSPFRNGFEFLVCKN
jgi:hypothetical protein